MNSELRYFFTALICLWTSQCFSQTWLPLEHGLGCFQQEQVYSIRQNESGSGLLIAGLFSNNGVCDTMRSVSFWDGNHLIEAAVHYGAYTSTLSFEFQNKIYASGHFVLPVSNPLDFNVSLNGEWQNVQNGYDGTAFDCIIHDDIAYMAGGFSNCNGMPCSLICSFDGEQVLPYYTGPPDGDLAYSVEVYQDTIYLGGNYTGNDGLGALGYGKCCKIVNGQLEKVAQGFSTAGVVYAMEVFDGKLYLGGSVIRRNSSDSHTMLYYENGQLHTLPTEPDFFVTAMRAYNGGLYVAGDFSNIGEMPCNRIARWDGHEWTCLSDGLFYLQNGLNCGADCIRDIEIWNDTLYIGGRFHRIGEDTLKRIAKLDMSLSEAFPVKVTEQQRQELKLHVYPNPAQEQLTITLPLGARPQDVLSVYDMHGRLVQEQRAGKYAGNISVDVSRLSGGMYVVKYHGRDVVLTQSFIKE